MTPEIPEVAFYSEQDASIADSWLQLTKVKNQSKLRRLEERGNLQSPKKQLRFESIEALNFNLFSHDEQDRRNRLEAALPQLRGQNI
jgi:hypothetical protein